jgi:hypothetical protein
MRFFDQSLVPDRVTHISAYQALDEDGGGIKNLTALLRREGKRSDAARARWSFGSRGEGGLCLRVRAFHP